MKIVPPICFRLAATLLAVSFLYPSAARSAEVFSTFGPGDSYNPAAGSFVGGSASFFGPSDLAAQFTAQASGNLATVDVAFSNTSSLATINLYLYGDAGGLPDNAAQVFLGSFMMAPDAASAIISVSVGGMVNVATGTTYWLVAKAATAFQNSIWHQSLPPVPGALAVSTDGTTWGPFSPTLPAFRLTADAATGVPETGSTLGLLVAGLSGIALLRARMRLL